MLQKLKRSKDTNEKKSKQTETDKEKNMIIIKKTSHISTHKVSKEMQRFTFFFWVKYCN